MANTVNIEVEHLTESQALKHVSVNAGFDKLDGALGSLKQITVTTANVTVVDADSLPFLVLQFIGASTGAREVTVPSNKKLYIINNTTSHTHTIRTAGVGTTVSITASSTTWTPIYCDGTNVVALSTGAGTDLTGLSDVTISSAATGQMLRKSAGDWVNEDVPYDVGASQNGTPTASSTVLAFAFNRAARLLSTPTIGGRVGTNPSAQTDFDMRKNGSSIGTLRVSTGGVFSAVSVTQTDFVAGDEFAVVAPSNLNGLVDLRFTIGFKRS